MSCPPRIDNEMGSPAAAFRGHFPCLNRVTHLASCSQGPLSTPVTDAVYHYLGLVNRAGAAWETWLAEVDLARAEFARLINASIEDITVLPNASLGAFQAAWGVRPGQTIVSYGHEFPSIAKVWLAQRQRGVRVVSQASDTMHDIDATLASVPLVSYADGSLAPVSAVVGHARAGGARTFIDAYQGAGIIPVDVTELACDYLVSGASKHLLGLPGIAFMYSAPHCRTSRPPLVTGWFSQTSDAALDATRLAFQTNGRRFETGTPAVIAAYAAAASLRLLNQQRPGAVLTHVTELRRYLARGLAALGLETIGPGTAELGTHLAMRCAQPAALSSWLTEQAIFTSPRGQAVRFAPHYYTTRADLDRLLDTLAQWPSRRGKRCPARSRAGARPETRRPTTPETTDQKGEQMSLLQTVASAITDGSVVVVDLTAPLSERTPVIELPPELGQARPFRSDVISRYDEAGPDFYWNNISLSEHTGTHLDAPVHWLSGRGLDDVSAIPPQRLIGPAVVLDVRERAAADADYLLTRRDVESWVEANGKLPEHGWLLVHTGWDARGDDPCDFLNDGHSPGIDSECARWLAEETSLLGIGVETVGIDAGQAGTFADRPFPCHWHLLGAGKYGITQLRNLHRLPTRGAMVIAAPLPIVGGSGSPARVLALVEAGGERWEER